MVLDDVDSGDESACLAALAQQPWWCGYNEQAMCIESDKCKFFFNGPKRGCYDKTYCKFPQRSVCVAVPLCTWKSRGGCQFVNA